LVEWDHLEGLGSAQGTISLGSARSRQNYELNRTMGLHQVEQLLTVGTTLDKSWWLLSQQGVVGIDAPHSLKLEKVSFQMPSGFHIHRRYGQWCRGHAHEELWCGDTDAPSVGVHRVPPGSHSGSQSAALMRRHNYKGMQQRKCELGMEWRLGCRSTWSAWGFLTYPSTEGCKMQNLKVGGVGQTSPSRKSMQALSSMAEMSAGGNRSRRPDSNSAIGSMPSMGSIHSELSSLLKLTSLSCSSKLSTREEVTSVMCLRYSVTVASGIGRAVACSKAGFTKGAGGGMLHVIALGGSGDGSNA
jgi:hypothetical protein